MLRQHNPIVLSFIGHPVVSSPLLKMSSWVVNRKGEPQYRRHFLADNSIFHGKYQIDTYTIFWHLHVLRMDTRGRCIAKKSASSNIRLESDCKANTTKPPYYGVKKRQLQATDSVHNIHGKTVHRCLCWQVIGLSFIAFFLLLMKSISLPSMNFSPWKRVPVKLKQDISYLFLTFPSVQGNVSMKLLPKQWFSNHLIIYIIGMITETTYQMLKLTDML